MNMDKGNITGSGKADMSGDVESKPMSGSCVKAENAYSRTQAVRKSETNNSDVNPSTYDTMNEGNGMSVIMPKGE